jgi:hypothetical protein
MDGNNKSGRVKSFLKILALIAAIEILIFILVFVVENYQILMIYITTSEFLRDAVAIIIEKVFL